MPSTDLNVAVRRPLRLVRAAIVLCFVAAAACASPQERVAKYAASGQSYLEKGDLGKAKIQFQNALKIDEENIPSLLGLAEVAERQHEFQTMAGILQRVVRLDPKNVDATIKLGKLYLIGGDQATAVELADKALALAPNNPEALSLKAALQLKLDDAAGATEFANKALALDPTNIEAVTVIAAERAKAGDSASALAAIDKVLAEKPKTAILLLLRIQLLENLDRKAELPAAYKKLIELFPDQAPYRQLYAAYLMRQNDLTGARNQFEEIVKLTPGDTESILNVVRVDYKIGGADAAKKTFQKYLEASPKDDKLQFAYGDFLRQQDDYTGAEKVYAAIVEKNDSQEAVLHAKNEIAGLRLLEGKKDEARAIVDEILKADARNSDALIKLAGLQVDDNKLDDAIANLRTVLADKPDSVQAKLMMGTAFEKKGDIDYATGQMAQAVETSKNSVTASLVFAKFLMRHNDPGRAEQVLRDCLDKHQGDVESLKLLASIQLMQQDWQGAEETAKAIESANAQDPSVNRILGAAYAGLGDYGGAIDALKKANEETPLSGRPLAALVRIYLKDGKAADAEKMLQGMIASDAKNYEAIVLLAQVYKTQKDEAQFRSTLKQAIAAAPDRLEAVEMLYRDYMINKDPDAAKQFLDDQLASKPDNDGVKILKADYFIATNKPEEAMALYADVLTRRPNDLIASNNYASLLSETKDDEASRAKALQVASVLKDAQNPYFVDTYGWALYRTGDYAGAVKALEKASAGAPAMVEITYHLGAAYAAAGDKEKARAALQKVVQAGDTPFLEKAKALLAKNGQ